MSKRQIIILWSIAAVLAAVVLIIKISQQDPDQVATERRPGETLFESFPAEDISRVTIKGAQQSLTLDKRDNAWVVVERDDYPADTTAVHELIRTINDLEVNRAIEAGTKLAPRFGMDADSKKEEKHGLEIGFFGVEGKQLARVSLGKNIEHNSAGNMPGATMMVGRYVRNHADESGFYGTTEMFSSISDDAKEWLRDVFINPEKIESVQVSKTDGEDGEWHLKRESEEAAFQVVDARPTEVANTDLANRLGNLFAYAGFDDVVPADELKQRATVKGKRTAIIKTFEGFTYIITMTPAAGNDQQYLLQIAVDATLPEERKKAEGESEQDAAKLDEAFAKRRQQLQDKLKEAKFFEGRTYLVPKSAVDPLLRNRADMVLSVEPEKEADTGQAPPLLTPGGTGS